jgi:hypothetical protein
MARGRPSKPLGWHLLTNNYRPSRHGPLPGSPPNPEVYPPEPVEVSALDAEARARLAAWRLTFKCGTDFFSDLEPYGVIEPCHADDYEAAARAFLKEAREAWAELGAVYMATWKPDPRDSVVRLPWALVTFGDPHGPLRRPRTLRR